MQQNKISYTAKFVKFCKRTNLHGYKYIAMNDLNIVERSLWAIAVVVSIAFAANFVLTAYMWYARNPIVTVIESTQGAIWDIPFPAVTICNLNVVSRKAARALADNLTLPDNITAEYIFETFRLVPLMHSSVPIKAEHKQKLRQLQTVLEFNHITIETLFRNLSPAHSCNHLVRRCMWKNTISRCEALFQPVFTHFSLCCIFNYYAVEITEKNILAGQRSKYIWPRRVASCGYQTALTVALNMDPDDYYSAEVAARGALILIDDAFNLPNVYSPVRLVNPATEMLIALSPERTYTTSGIKAFSPKDRQCYYNNEIQIGNFQKYTFHNCLAFQGIEMIRNACDCIPLYFPLKNYYRTCNFNDMDCLEKYLGQEDIHQRAKQDNGKSFRCLPECEHYDYPLEVASGKLTNHGQLRGIPFSKNFSFEHHSIISVFFNDLVSTRYRRDVYLNWQNLLASFGGLLSLMLGFTLIAGFDLIVFLTYGLACGSLNNDLINDEQKINYSNN